RLSLRFRMNIRNPKHHADGDNRDDRRGDIGNLITPRGGHKKTHGQKTICAAPTKTPSTPVALPRYFSGTNSAMSADSATVSAPKPVPRSAENSKTTQASVPKRWPNAGTPSMKAETAMSRR